MVALDHLVRFGLGIIVVAGLFALVRICRLRLQGWWGVRALLGNLSHFTVAGLLTALAFPSGARLQVSESMEMGIHLLGAWFAFCVGCSLDRLAFRRGSAVEMIREVGQFGLCSIMVMVVTWVVLQVGGLDQTAFEWPTVLALCALVGFGTSTFGSKLTSRPSTVAECKPLIAAALGTVVFAIGVSELRLAEIKIGLPFAPSGRELLIEGRAMELILTVVLGFLVGLVADLLTRDCQRKMVLFLLILSLMFGGGIAAVCGLEPFGVGLAAAVWLINTTLRRLDVLRVSKAGGSLMNGGIHFSGGWFLGCFLAQWGLDWRTTAFVFLAIVAIRPLAGLGAVFLVGRFMPMPSLRSLWVAPATLLGTSDLALVAALIFGYLLPDPVGGSIVAAMVAAQWLLSMCKAFFKEDVLLNAAGIPPAQSSPQLRL